MDLARKGNAYPSSNNRGGMGYPSYVEMRMEKGQGDMSDDHGFDGQL